MKPLVLLIPLILLTGCATQPLQVTAPCPAVNLPDEPHYPVQDLKRGDSAATVAKAYVATVQLQEGYIGELLHIYGGYK
jgi:uncharacterized lipoprotein YajG